MERKVSDRRDHIDLVIDSHDIERHKDVAQVPWLDAPDNAARLEVEDRTSDYHVRESIREERGDLTTRYD